MFGNSKTVKTNKTHTCFSCFRKFPAGTVMDKWSCVVDGSWNSGYTCPTCVEIHDLHRKQGEDFYDGIPEGYTREGLSENQTPEEYLIENREYYERKKNLLEVRHYQ